MPSSPSTSVQCRGSAAMQECPAESMSVRNENTDISLIIYPLLLSIYL